MEGGRALEVEEDKYKIITEKTVFDHIREKSRNFSLLPAFGIIRCPSVEVFLPRSHGREKRSYSRHEVIVLDDDDKVPGENDVNLPSELRKAEDDDINLCLTLNDHNTAENSNSVSSIVGKGTPFYKHVILQSLFFLLFFLMSM